jgi:hypothetical protein
MALLLPIDTERSSHGRKSMKAAGANHTERAMHYSGFFYGVPGDKLDEFRAAVATLKTIFSSVYSADNLIALNRNLSFTQDKKFLEAFRQNVQAQQ